MRALSLAGLTTLAACTVVPTAAPPPPPPPPLQPAPAPPPPPPVAVAPEKPWDVAPLTPGIWRYEKQDAASIASFGIPGGSRVAALRCEPGTRQLTFSIGVRAVASAVPVSIRTTSGTLAWNGISVGGDNPSVLVTRPANDSGFDWIAYSRGRISAEAQGVPRLILPVWAEISRVIEDCRG
ncbi:MAG: hypothetical protein J7485_03995 [Sphingobium sp.]|nr:hypothetical protein [Sphingobium sp.]